MGDRPEDAHSRTERLLGKGAMDRLRKSHVMVFGIGGVGSHCIEALARSGIGRLTLIDKDVVSPSNINRQSIALHSTLGQYKTRVMQKKVLDINPEIQVQVFEEFALPENVAGFFEREPGIPDFVVDAIDTVSTKIALAELSEERGVPMISCMGTGNKLDPFAFEIADIYETSVCPLCRVMRRELKKRKISRLPVLYSREKPVICGEEPSAVIGSVSFVPPVAGLMLAGYVIKKLMEGEVHGE
ncbi:MAG: tRNA threonylcarbamoyladenosine dehydratase [Lachnospiraceae bacterium]|nr:tRNA threonylcarbamoyladenosine dehydratase [Lachnospiraceae bacterium]